MQTLNIKNILFVIIAFVLGCSLASLFSGCGSETDTASKPIRPSEIKKQVNNDENRFRKIADSLENRGKRIAAALNATGKHLETARRDNSFLQEQIADLTEKYVTAFREHDTVKILEDCAGLFPKARELVQSAQLQDSLCNETASQMQSLILIKDSVIQVMNEQYVSLRKNFDSGMNNLETAVNENRNLHRKIRKQKIKNMVVSAAAAIGSGLALKWLIKK